MYICALSKSYAGDYDDVRLWRRDKEQDGGRERREVGGVGWLEDDSLGTCSVGLLQQTRLIRADKGEIRRLEIEKVVCVCGQLGGEEKGWW